MRSCASLKCVGVTACKPWTSWQRVNIHRYGTSYLRKLLRRQLQSRKTFKTSIEFAQIVLAQGGRVHFERPSHCQGWKLVELQDFCNRHQLHLVKCNACAFGSEHFHPWTIATSSEDLASMLRSQHDPLFRHVPCKGGKAEKSALYPPKMYEAAMAQLFPKKFHQAVPSMPVFQQPLKPMCKMKSHQRMSMRLHCQIHEVLSRKDWINDPAALADVKKEADGLVKAGNVDIRLRCFKVSAWSRVAPQERRSR